MKGEVRSKSVGTKVTEAELRVLESQAERAGLTLSAWVRDVLLGSSVEQGTLAAERAITRAGKRRVRNGSRRSSRCSF
jgi:Mobilization protein NikA